MWWIIILLILIGLLLLVLEILVIPGAGVPGIVGFGLMVTGVWLSYSRIGTYEGNIVLLSTIAVNVVGVIIAVRSKTWNRAMLNTENTGRVNLIDSEKIKVGEQGITISRCTPMGKVLINGEYVEVSALSEFIDPNTKVEIIKIQGNKVYIKQIKDS
ncbi:MAG: hypothetical protein C0595_07585 [Marinilabiliales bacterium]|nr:MAG: hypothetical protein C0595_07585 [Marinilabiliales bacterium]